MDSTPWLRASQYKLTHPIDKLEPAQFKHLQTKESSITDDAIKSDGVLGKRGIILPSSVMLTQHLSPVDDQGQLGSCVSCSVSKLVEERLRRAADIKTSEPGPILSRLFLYWFGREMMCGSPPASRYRDPGDSSSLYVVFAFLALSKYSSCLQSLWPYVSNNQHYLVKPPPNLVAKARQSYFLRSFYNVATNLTALKTQLASGNPISFAFVVYSSFITTSVAKSGIIPIPNTSQEKLLGGHSMLIVGYEDEKQSFYVQNSWGSDWGLGGFAWFPYQYMLTLAGEFFTTTQFIALPPKTLAKPTKARWKTPSLSPMSSSNMKEEKEKEKKKEKKEETEEKTEEKKEKKEKGNIFTFFASLFAAAMADEVSETITPFHSSFNSPFSPFLVLPTTTTTQTQIQTNLRDPLPVLATALNLGAAVAEEFLATTTTNRMENQNENLSRLSHLSDSINDRLQTGIQIFQEEIEKNTQKERKKDQVHAQKNSSNIGDIEKQGRVVANEIKSVITSKKKFPSKGKNKSKIKKGELFVFYPSYPPYPPPISYVQWLKHYHST